ncbi:MAG: hypothetical protein L6Q37_12315 [Bdellovibrionaceae bacterium]|nr:hypothetical protein [Pseudobdellovibrionaceae bacterium]
MGIILDDSRHETQIENPNTSDEDNPKTLKFSFKSNHKSDVKNRVLFENQSWSLTGYCQSQKGQVVISGDIDQPIKVDCINNTFAVTINYTQYTPYFINIRGLSRYIRASQADLYDETIIYKANSSRGSPIFIYNKEQFLSMDLSNDNILAKDIDFLDVGQTNTNNFKPIFAMNSWSFTGALEGDNHFLLNLQLRTTDENVCLFPFINGGVIKNLTLQEVEFSSLNNSKSTSKLSGLVCTAIGLKPFYLENILIQGKLFSDNEFSTVGGLIAESYQGEIKKVVVQLLITGNAKDVGGVIGKAENTFMENLFSKSNINIDNSNQESIGGLIGTIKSSSLLKSSVINSFFWGTIEGTQNIGGLVGSLKSNNSLIQSSFAISSIQLARNTSGGPIIGNKENFLIDLNQSFYLAEGSCSNCTNSFGTPLEEESFKSKKTYKDWDFKYIWRLDEGNSFPYIENH